MMGFKQVITQFKQKHAQGITLDVLPQLVNDLVKDGLDLSTVEPKFYTELAKEIFDNPDSEAQSYVIDALFLLSQLIPAPKPSVSVPKVISEPVKPKVAVPTAAIDGDIVVTEHLVATMPSEDEEGDPFYIAPEDRINLRPEDMAPMEYDEEYCKLLGIDPKSRKA